MTSDARVQELREWLTPLASKYGFSLDSMTAASSDASFRSYFRVGGADTSFIVMDAPPPAEDVRPFIRVDEMMAEAGLNVPKIYEQDVERGFLLLSDLGTQTYLDALDKNNANKLMSDAIDSLVLWQKASKPGVLPEYDSEVLRRELELFPTWYLERHRGIKLTDMQRRMLDHVFDLIILQVSSQAKVYVHRDYMLRNLMVTEEANPGVLDFQDALYGPVSYDIASLCHDAFISWDEPIVLDWTIRYWERARAAGVPVPEDFGKFWTDIEWMGLQRHLKVLGIFARINYRDGKPKYLEDTPRFLAYVSAVAHRYDVLKPLARLIDQLENVEQQTGYTF